MPPRAGDSRSRPGGVFVTFFVVRLAPWPRDAPHSIPEEGGGDDLGSVPASFVT